MQEDGPARLDEEEAWRQMNESTRQERRRRYRESTIEERLEAVLDLSEFVKELRSAMLRSR